MTIWRGRSAAEGYKFDDRIEGDSLQTAEAIFDVNANGRDWKKHPDPGSANPDILHYWETGDAKVFAAIWRSEPAILEVSDQAFMQERNRGLKAAGSGAGGF